MIRVFIGYDDRESVAFSVLSHSIQVRASEPVLIAPVMRSQIKAFQRPRSAYESTDFSISRFLVPYLCGYEGHAIFMDCDILCQDDIAKLWNLRDDRYAVQVVKHDYNPENQTKFLGERQTQYQKKNWSSVMLFNNSKCKALTPEYVNRASGLELHQFHWLDGEIGELPPEWNYLVGHSKGQASLIHYTQGGPWFPEYADCEHSEKWFAEADFTHRVLSRLSAL